MKMSGKSRGKAKVHISKPEPPPFLQRMREQIVANEDAERKEQSEKRRKNRSNRGLDDTDDDYTVVKLDADGLTEDEVKEYKKIKKAMETQYKINSNSKQNKQEELDIDALIDSRADVSLKTIGKTIRSKSLDEKAEQSGSNKDTTSKKLSYESSSDED